MLLSQPLASLSNDIFQDEFNKILAQQSKNVRSHNWIQRIKLKNKGPKHTHLAMYVNHVLEFLRRNTCVQHFGLWRHEILFHTSVR